MRPRVHVNCAVSLDGRLAGPGGVPVPLSCEEDLRRVHALRASHDTILVGVGTVLADDPSLRVKPHLASGDDPIPVVLDTRLRTPAEARVRRRGAIIVTAPGAGGDLEVPLAGGGGLDLPAVLAGLAGRGFASVFVEGGGNVIRSFVNAGLVDTWTVYQAPIILGDGPVVWPGAPGPEGLRGSAKPLGDGVLWTLQT